MSNALYYGDNLDILRRKIKDETVDLCYIDPPFNTKRNYNQIYNNVGEEDRAQAQAFTDTWTWDDHAIEGYNEIIANDKGRFQSHLVDLIKGLEPVLGHGSLLAYLISMALRITEIHRVIKPTGSFYLHCDPTAGHYLKILLDAIFCSQGGSYLNEIVWGYRTGGAGKKYFARKHDLIYGYTKSSVYNFNVQYYKSWQNKRYNYNPKYPEHFDEDEKKWYHLSICRDVWEDLNPIGTENKERLGYPTQKPESLLERIITASSNEGDTILDAYCGCGTTIAVAERLKRKWLGMDITYQSISLILRRLEFTFEKAVLSEIRIDGIPKDMQSANALAHKKDDRLRKEFEKWAVLTYTNNRAIINEKKGADAGIDARAFFLTGKDDNAKIIFQVKSGGVKRGDIATLRGDMARENAALAILITLEEPSKPMIAEAKGAGQYLHESMGRNYDRISIVTIQDIVEGGKRLEIPMSVEVVAAAKRKADTEQIDLL
jgi:DNA modification methylase